jgi:hypothetical protein
MQTNKDAAWQKIKPQNKKSTQNKPSTETEKTATTTTIKQKKVPPEQH